MANENQSTNEQPQTDAAATANTATAAATATEEKAAESSVSEKGSNDNSPVKDPKATIKIEGQEFEIEAALAQEDKTLKVVLQPHFASIENANITREVKDGKLTVTIVKRAQHKGQR